MTGQDDRLSQLINSAFAEGGPVARAFFVRGRAYRRNPSQVEYAHAVARTFITRGGTSLLEMDSGTGKSLGYLVPLALHCALNTVRGLVAVATPAAAEQLARSELAMAAEAIYDLTRRRLIFARRYAAQDFLSRTKISALLDAIGEGDSDLRTVLLSLRAFCDDSGLLPDWIRDNGMLPPVLDTHDVTLTAAHDRDSEKYTAHLPNAADADILVVPQTLLARHLRTGSKLPPGAYACAIIDEGDEWPDTIERVAALHVSTLDLPATPSRDAFTALAARLAREHPRQSFLLLSDARFEAERMQASQLAKAIGGLERFVLACETPQGPDTPLISWSPCVATPAFEVRPGGATKMGALPAGLDSLCMTASDFGDHGVFRRSIGLEAGDGGLDGDFTPRRFGSLSFNLSYPSAPKPSVSYASARIAAPGESGRNPAWFDHVEAVCARAGGLRQRALVLTCNFPETAELARRLRARGLDQVIEHARGERLSESLSAFRARGDAMLIAPNLWEGVDLPGLVRHVIITRLPIASRHSPALQIEAERLRAQGLGEADVTLRIFDILSRRARRKLAHGLGRAIRQAGDDAQVWITDPRFPLPDSLTGNARLHLPANIPVFREFAQCIPRRFRSGLIATWPSSTLIDIETRVLTDAAPPLKGRSRHA